ncbi:MAG TPA: PLD nuclease N-terminal domain-containing protein [Myxococcota bacterium]|nr:PLD nuclease N-terminal domain-containing protein [Myxococcota bacterium]
MQTALAKRIDELVEIGWEPVTTTETSASLVGRRPFSWWLFLLVIVFFPFFGGILYLIFWLATSRATVFLHEEANQVHIAGDTWLVSLQESQRAAMIEQRRQIRERGFLAVMWPQLLAFLVLLVLWVWFLRWYF